MSKNRIRVKNLIVCSNHTYHCSRDQPDNFLLQPKLNLKKTVIVLKRKIQHGLLVEEYV